MRDEILRLDPNAPEDVPDFVVPMADGRNVSLKSGTNFPFDAHPDFELLIVATAFSGQEKPVLCQSTWGSLKDLIETVDLYSSADFRERRESVLLAVGATSPSHAAEDPARFADYLADLTILMVMTRRERGRKLPVLAGDTVDLMKLDLPRLYCSMLFV